MITGAASIGIGCAHCSSNASCVFRHVLSTDCNDITYDVTLPQQMITCRTHVRLVRHFLLQHSLIPFMQVLWLADNNIRDITGLGHLTSLLELNLARNMIEVVGDALEANKALQSLNFADNRLGSFKQVQFILFLCRSRCCCPPLTCTPTLNTTHSLPPCSLPLTPTPAFNPHPSLYPYPQPHSHPALILA